MVKWNDPSVVAYVFFIYEQIAVMLLGLFGSFYVWSIHLEWELIMRKRMFRFVHVPLLLARYTMLSALLFFVITGRSKDRIACDIAYRTFAGLGSGAAMLASITLCTRPVTLLWALRRFVLMGVLTLLGFGQCFIVILQGILTVRARWDWESESCEVFNKNSSLLAMFYLYTFCYDVVILGMTLYGVHCVNKERCGRRRWRVGDALCIQGIGYVAVTCLVNIPVTVLAFLDLNAAMNVLLSLPAVTISVIASSLTTFAMDDLSDADAACRRASDLVSGALPGGLTTHLTMDIGLDSRVVFDDDLPAGNKMGISTPTTESEHVAP